MLCFRRLNRYIFSNYKITDDNIINYLEVKSNNYNCSINQVAIGFLIHNMVLSPKITHYYYKYVKYCSYFHKYGYNCIYDISYLNNTKELKIYIYKQRKEKISLTRHLSEEHNNIFSYVCKWESNMLMEYTIKYFTSYYFDQKIKKIKCMN